MKNHWKNHFKYYDFFQNNFTPYIQTINFHINQMDGYSKVLDSGAGTGNLTLELLKNKHNIVAIDSEKTALESLKNKIYDNVGSMELILADAEQTNFSNNNFDGITSMFVLPFVKSIKEYLSESYRILKKDGKMSISSWAPEVSIFPQIKEQMETEFKRKGILPKYITQWNYFLESSNQNAKIVIEKESLNQIKEIIKEIGFKRISIFEENPYKEFAYFITCKK